MVEDEYTPAPTSPEVQEIRNRMWGLARATQWAVDLAKSPNTPARKRVEYEQAAVELYAEVQALLLELKRLGAA